MVLLLVSLVLFIAMLIARKHVSFAVSMIPFIVLLGASIYFSYMKEGSFWFVGIIFVTLVFMIVKTRSYYDFDHRILTLTPNMNKNKGRILGRVFPAYKSQLKYNNSQIVQSELSSRGGTLVTGSTGSGKTYTIESLIHQDLDAGKSVAFFDFKGNTDIIDNISSNHPDIPIYSLSYNGCNFVYDPLENLDEGGKVEALLNIRKWSLDGKDDHYKSGVQLFLQKSVSDYQHQGGNYLKGLYKKLKMTSVGKEEWDSYNTVLKLLELTLSSKVSDMFEDEGRRFTFDTDDQFILIVSFTSATKTLGTSITSMMFRDMMERGTRREYDPGLCLYVDEFGSCDSPEIVKDIVEKGRSCGIASLLSMQDISQLAISTNEYFVDSILGTMNNYMIFAGATKAAAEKLAGVQVQEIESTLQLLKKPINGKAPTAIYISKYPVFKKQASEWYRFVPYDYLKYRNEEKDKKPATNSNLIKIEAEPEKTVLKINSSSTAVLEPEPEPQRNNLDIDLSDFL